MTTASSASIASLPQSLRVYSAINAVQAELAKQGITKSRKNTQQNYNFRGIDDVYNAVAPLLAQHGLCILPRCVSRDCVERESQRGGALFYVTVGVEFDFVSSEDGSRHTVSTYGEAMDSGDKATNKAMSAAYKYALMQAFAIPTEGDNDTENHTHTVKAQTVAERIVNADRPHTPTQEAKDAFDALSVDEKDLLDQYAKEITALFGEGGDLFTKVAALELSNDHMLALWSRLSAPVRSEYKRQKKAATSLAEQA